MSFPVETAMQRLLFPDGHIEAAVTFEVSAGVFRTFEYSQADGAAPITRVEIVNDLPTGSTAVGALFEVPVLV